MCIKRKAIKVSWYLVYVLFSFAVCASDSEDDLFMMDLEELINVQITSASLTSNSQRFSPSTISYISSKALKKRGVRTLSQALSFLPGTDIQKRRNGRDMVWFRGIPSGRNTKIMLLVDGVPYREPVFGGWSPDEEVPLNNIHHIEVIRGPGSALYGGNAYSGLISIFTNDKAPDKTEIKLTAGLFDTHSLRLNTGYELDKGSLIFSGEMFKTQGHKMSRDRKGNETDHKNNVFSYNSHFKINWQNFKASINTNHYNTEYPLYSIKQTKPQDYKIFSANLEHKVQLDKIDWLNKIYTYQVDRQMNRRRWDDKGELFFQATSFLNTRLFGATSRMNYKGHNQNILVGLSAESSIVAEYAEIINLNNYQKTHVLQSVLDKNGDNSPETKNFAIFVQDELFLLNNNLRPTFSLRYDKYEAFDAELSPRVGLVYAIGNRWTAKALWGKAFRPPSNLQQYEVRSDGNSPGSSDIEPEKIISKELDISYRINQSHNMNIRYFHNTLSNFIQSINAEPYANSEFSKSSSGFELEYIANLDMQIFDSEHMQLRINSTYLNSNEPSVSPVNNSIQGIIDFNFSSFTFSINHNGRRNTSKTYHTRVGDNEYKAINNKNSYVTFDLNVWIKKPLDLPIDIELSALNIFNTQYYNPTYAPDSYYDVTRAPRFFSIGIQYSF